MRRILGYLEGKPLWSDNEPGFARVQGYGGRMLLAGDLVVSTVTVTQRVRGPDERRGSKAEEVLRRELEGDPRPGTPRCNAVMHYGDKCARYTGHAQGHRSRFSLDNRARERRTA